MGSRLRVTDEEILRILERGPVTPDEVAKEIGVAWATAQGRLLRLVAEGKLIAVRKGKVNIYLQKFPVRVTPRTPSWAKARDLEELSRELEPYFPNNVSASEMVERERRRS
jgi:DNA-binding transcriptional ArsR family regulator